MNKTQNRSNSKTKIVNKENSNKKQKSNITLKTNKNSIPKMEKLIGRKGKDLISPKTIDYSKCNNLFLIIVQWLKNMEKYSMKYQFQKKSIMIIR